MKSDGDSDSRIRVAIVCVRLSVIHCNCISLTLLFHSGGGIGGLALATFLSSSEHDTANLDISLYEASPSLTELGAGVGVWLRTWRILSSYSFDSDDVRARASEHGRAEAAEEDEVGGLAKELRKIAPEGRDMSDGIRE